MPAKINNSELVQGIVNTGKLQSGKDVIPTLLSEQVVPVIVTNPRLIRNNAILKAASLSNATTANVYTTPSDQDFYVCSASLAMIKDASATSTAISLSVTINSATVNLLAVPSITLTAHTEAIAVSFPYPIKIDRGSNIQIVSSTNVANILARGQITGFVVESKD